MKRGPAIDTSPGLFNSRVTPHAQRVTQLRTAIRASRPVGIVRLRLRRNERDVEDVPEELRRELSFIFVDDASEVLQHALVPSPVRVQVA